MKLLKDEVQHLVMEALETLGGDSSLVEKMLQASREITQGDLTLPCFPFAKALGMAPVAIAENLKDAMKPHDAVGDVTAVNGYLNIRA